MKPTPLLRVAFLVVSLALLTALPAGANRPREHDGFFLRLSGGFGGASTEIDALDFGEVESDVEFSGMSGNVNFAIGGVVSRNLALHGTLIGWAVSDPEVEIGGTDFETDETTLSMGLIGGGLTYYFMPSNVYVTGSIGAATLTLDVDGDDQDSDTGLGVELGVGKEWWVGNRWGLGIAGHFGFHSIPAGDIDEDFTGQEYGLRFSATFN